VSCEPKTLGPRLRGDDIYASCLCIAATL